MTARALLSCATLHSPTHPVPPICTSPVSVCASLQSTPRCRKTQPRWAVITLNLIFFILFLHCRARGTFLFYLIKRWQNVFLILPASICYWPMRRNNRQNKRLNSFSKMYLVRCWLVLDMGKIALCNTWQDCQLHWGSGLKLEGICLVTLCPW